MNETSQSHSLSFSESPQPGKDNGGKKKHDVDVGHSGAGHGGRAGGAGAVPVSSDMINIHSDFEQEGPPETHRDESYMSYIYGDEDSQHHKLPEYSNEHVNEHVVFEPKLTELAEDDEDKFDGVDTLETSDHETDDGDDSKSDGKMGSNETLVSMDTPVSANSNIDMDLVNKQHSSSSKLTIKIYPPALQAVASKSPVASSDADVDTPDGYLD
eukprot:UN00768